MAVHPLFVLASFSLVLALVTCGISLFAPFWLGNVTTPWPGSDTQPVEYDLTYITKSNLPSTYTWRGLWAQCSSECQWFWDSNYSLQSNKFTPLGWHLATQVLYFVGVSLVLLCEVYARAQLCCTQRKSVYRTLGIVLLVSFVLQAAAISVFGGFASRDYGATASVSSKFTYFAFCFWMALVGSFFTLLGAIFFVAVDFVAALPMK